ncbi:hypothetical protein P2P98_03250 [Microbacterium sp. Kw_RZR3]|uniref:hypothetical protein n=1 Tax=Microbacterium sp. Kw_RZR3 TaxID=3032903 RepID=UPI0023DA5D15|nr:hypothetical protein [Microbacterium sp. Kw_RZR3]MDF2045166.1 hypothetical protein [Microbacterium sp. Kw_RZR3]
MTLIGMESLVREIEAEFRHVNATVKFQAVQAGATLMGGKVDLVSYTTVDGEKITFSPEVEMKLINGVLTVPVNLEPTDGSWGWSVKVSIISGRHHKTWLKGVPVRPDGVVVPFGDLPNLDPATLQPTEDVLDAWATVRAETFQARDDTEGLRDETLTLRDEAREALAEVEVRTLTATPDPDDPTVLILTFPSFMLDPDGSSILLPLEATT